MEALEVEGESDYSGVTHPAEGNGQHRESGDAFLCLEEMQRLGLCDCHCLSGRGAALSGRRAVLSL